MENAIFSHQMAKEGAYFAGKKELKTCFFLLINYDNDESTAYSGKTMEDRYF